MSTIPDKDRKAARPPSAERERQRRRIWRTTRALAVGGVAATAAFVFAAAHGGHRATSTPTADPLAGSADTGAIPLSRDDGTESGDDDGGVAWDDDGGPYSSPSIAPSQAAPTPSTLPPVARSGGS